MNNIWLIGAGAMAQDYIKVLDALNTTLTIIGRGSENAEKCKTITGSKVVSGGLHNFLLETPTVCSHAIVAVGVEKLFETTQTLLEYGVKNILVEKPGAMSKTEFESLINLKKEKSANILIAYNRRFFSSVLKAKELIAIDGGVSSFNFEFTEWSHVIEPLVKPEGVKEKWLFVNSTHVLDLAFFLGGKPKEMSSFTNGSLPWHPVSNFSGAGVSDKGALFSYQANWESAGRWAVEVLTTSNRFIFKPMEKLQVQKRGTIAQEIIELDSKLDDEYKPGLYLQTKQFLANDFSNMCSIEEQCGMIDNYNKIANYL